MTALSPLSLRGVHCQECVICMCLGVLKAGWSFLYKHSGKGVRDRGGYRGMARKCTRACPVSDRIHSSLIDPTFPDNEHDRMAEFSLHFSVIICSSSGRNGHARRTTQDRFSWQLGAGSHVTSNFPPAGHARSPIVRNYWHH